MAIKKQKIGELFCGPGGVGLGAAKSRVRHEGNTWITEPVWINDFCEDTCNTWEHNILKYERKIKAFKGDVKIFNCDVRDINFNTIKPIDGLIFGFPCNDFSIVGEKKGIYGEFGPLYQYGVKVLKKKDNPKWFMAENVGGITSANNGEALNKILVEMKNAGYVLTAHKYKFEDYGIPQARHRIIIIGFREDLELTFDVPNPSYKYKTCGDVLEKPIQPHIKNNELTKQSEKVIQRLKFIEPGENAWSEKIPKNLKLNVEKTRLSHIYKRLDPKKPSYTVTGGGGGGTHMYHWIEDRALTNRERARLQTFPDSFEFKGSKESVRKQIGMAIPVDAAKILIEAILKKMAGKNYKSIPPNIQIPLL